MILSHCEEKEERRRRGRERGREERREGRVERKEVRRGETFQSVLEKKMVSEAICTLATGPLQI